jgi:type IV pilus assembly protein PilY1
VDPTKLFPANGPDGPWGSNPGINIWPVHDTYLFYTANYINWLDGSPPDVVQSRLAVVQNVVNDLLTSVNGARIGIMRFSSNGQGGMVVHPVADVATDRDALIASMNAMGAGGSTPLAEALYEHSSTWRAVQSTSTHWSATAAPLPSGYSRNGSIYATPITEQCQRNFVVVSRTACPAQTTPDADARIEALPGFAQATGAATCTESCLDEMSKYLEQTDLSPIEGTQNALTYTIGFTTDTELLADTATATKPDGSPAYYQANDLSGLQSAFAEILQNIDAETHTFASPAVSVNSFTRHQP